MLSWMYRDGHEVERNIDTAPKKKKKKKGKRGDGQRVQGGCISDTFLQTVFVSQWSHCGLLTADFQIRAHFCRWAGFLTRPRMNLSITVISPCSVSAQDRKKTQNKTKQTNPINQKKTRYSVKQTGEGKSAVATFSFCFTLVCVSGCVVFLTSVTEVDVFLCLEVGGCRGGQGGEIQAASLSCVQQKRATGQLCFPTEPRTTATSTSILA